MSNFRNKISEITEILTFPDVLVEVNNLITRTDTSASDIAKVINSDIALSTKILKLVNSSYYGFSKQITSINYAIVILGFSVVRNLAVTIFVQDIKSNNICGFKSKQFWMFSISTGLVAQYLCEFTQTGSKDDAYISGLLHDIGVVILNQYFSEEFTAVFTYAQSNNCTLLEAERRILDFDHVEIGSIILESWNFPERIINVCNNYSCPDKVPEETMPSIIHLSDGFCRALKLGNPADNSLPELSNSAMSRLRVVQEDIYPLLKKILSNSKLINCFL